jgi:hypothetical protein
MKTPREWTLPIAGFAVLLWASSPYASQAAQIRRECKLEAHLDRSDCKSVCQDNYDAAIAICNNQNPICAEDCREDRRVCRQPIQDALQNQLAVCNATLRLAIANCNSNFSPGGQREQCIGLAEVEAFDCRTDARRIAKFGDHTVDPPVLGFEDCKSAFQGCIQICRHTPPPP